MDPSPGVLMLAARRGIRVTQGFGEALPYRDLTFDGLLMVVSICYLSSPSKAMKECARVLKPNGELIVGLVPADSPWGAEYARKGAAGHPFYSPARFYTCDQVVSLARQAGFALTAARSCLFRPPGEPVSDGVNRSGVVGGAGFVGFKFGKAKGAE